MPLKLSYLKCTFVFIHSFDGSVLLLRSICLLISVVFVVVTLRTTHFAFGWTSSECLSSISTTQSAKLRNAPSFSIQFHSAAQICLLKWFQISAVHSQPRRECAPRARINYFQRNGNNKEWEKKNEKSKRFYFAQCRAALVAFSFTLWSWHGFRG